MNEEIKENIDEKEKDSCCCSEEHECCCNDECENNVEKHECHCNEENKKESKKKKKEEKNKFKDENKELKEKISKLEQDVLVARADLVNYRKRKDEDVIKMLKFCNEDLIKALLPTIDNFERAIKMDDDNLDDEVSKFLEGFKMVYCSFNEVLKKFEVKTIEESNVEFDPNYHNAIMVEKREGVKPGIVLEVLQKGYTLKDKVIRPAMVKVSE